MKDEWPWDWRITIGPPKRPVPLSAGQVALWFLGAVALGICIGMLTP